MLSVETVTKWMELFGEQLMENKTYLSELDTAIGDGDHGNNLARGAAALKEKLGANEYNTLTDLLKDVGMVFVSKIGGASGPLYGSAFISMAKASKDNDSLELADLLAAGLDGIQKRGKAEAGEKTMVDEWISVVEAVKNNSLTTDTVVEAVEKTKDMKATKGRASYLGDRSIGHLDPGAMSSSILFKTMLEAGVYDGK